MAKEAVAHLIMEYSVYDAEAIGEERRQHEIEIGAAQALLTYQNGLYERGWFDDMASVFMDESEQSAAELFAYFNPQQRLFVLMPDLRNVIQMQTDPLRSIETTSFSMLRTRNTYRLTVAEQREVLTQHLRPLIM